MTKSTVSQSCSTKVKHIFSPVFGGSGECPLCITSPSNAEELCVAREGEEGCGTLCSCIGDASLSCTFTPLPALVWSLDPGTFTAGPLNAAMYLLSFKTSIYFAFKFLYTF